MNRTVQIILICAAVFFVVGLIFIVAAASNASFRWDRLFQEAEFTFTERSEVITESFSSLELTDAAADVHIVPAADGNVTVTLKEQKGFPHEIKVENDTLVITYHDTRHWWQMISFFPFDFSKISVTVALPEAEYQSLALTTASGDLIVPSDFTFEKANLVTASGDISYRAETKEALKIISVSGDIVITGNAKDMTVQSTSGDIQIAEDSGNSLSVKTTSGEVEIENCKLESDFEIKSVSGNIDLEEISGNSTLTVNTTSGELRADRVTGFGALYMKSVSGNIRLASCDAQSLELHSTSGNITASLLSPKTFSTSSVSGSISTPASDAAGGSCRATTVSGSIRIQLV